MPPSAPVAGAASLVEPVTIRTGTGAEPIQLALRDPIFMEDLIATSPEGGTRITFVDGSELTIGPSSELVIDSFVYTPQGHTTMVARLGVGALRFVSGPGSHDITVAGPAATMGLRGTSIDVYAPGNGDQLLHVGNGFVQMVAGNGPKPIVGAGQFGLIREGESFIVVGPVAGPIEDVMERLSFEYPRGQAVSFLALAAAASQIPFGEVLQIAGLQPILQCPDGSSGVEGGCGGVLGRLGGSGPDEDDELQAQAGPPPGAPPQDPPPEDPPPPDPPPNDPPPNDPPGDQSGLGDGTNPGRGGGRDNSPNQGTGNPNQSNGD